MKKAFVFSAAIDHPENWKKIKIARQAMTTLDDQINQESDLVGQWIGVNIKESSDSYNCEIYLESNNDSTLIQYAMRFQRIIDEIEFKLNRI